jgi:hypothetical protein
VAINRRRAAWSRCERARAQTIAAGRANARARCVERREAHAFFRDARAGPRWIATALEPRNTCPERMRRQGALATARARAGRTTWRSVAGPRSRAFGFRDLRTFRHMKRRSRRGTAERSRSTRSGRSPPLVCERPRPPREQNPDQTDLRGSCADHRYSVGSTPSGATCVGQIPRSQRRPPSRLGRSGRVEHPEKR